MKQKLCSYEETQQMLWNVNNNRSETVKRYFHVFGYVYLYMEMLACYIVLKSMFIQCHICKLHLFIFLVAEMMNEAFDVLIVSMNCFVSVWHCTEMHANLCSQRIKWDKICCNLLQNPFSLLSIKIIIVFVEHLSSNRICAHMHSSQWHSHSYFKLTVSEYPIRFSTKHNFNTFVFSFHIQMILNN